MIAKCCLAAFRELLSPSYRLSFLYHVRPAYDRLKAQDAAFTLTSICRLRQNLTVKRRASTSTHQPLQLL
ncbi:MAG: hypothetical protein V3R87_04620 [Dehalococcoidia bacterium]